MLEDDCPDLGRRLHFKATTSSGSPLRSAGQPSLRIYKPWLDAIRHELGGRKEMSSGWSRTTALPGQHEKAYSTTPHLGRHPRAKSLETWTPASRSSTRSWACGSGTRRWRSARGRDDGFERGRPVTINGKEFGSPVDLVLEANAIGGRHGWACPTRSRNRIIEAKSRASTRRPAWPWLHAAYERLSTPSTTRTPGQLPQRGRRLGRLMYEGRWLDRRR